MKARTKNLVEAGNVNAVVAGTIKTIAAVEAQTVSTTEEAATGIAAAEGNPEAAAGEGISLGVLGFASKFVDTFIGELAAVLALSFGRLGRNLKRSWVTASMEPPVRTPGLCHLLSRSFIK